jgi:hypothetical protein
MEAAKDKNIFTSCIRLEMISMLSLPVRTPCTIATARKGNTTLFGSINVTNIVNTQHPVLHL